MVAAQVVAWFALDAAGMIIAPTDQGMAQVLHERIVGGIQLGCRA